MSKIAIKAENISKAYQLGEFSTGTLSRDIQRRWALMRGKEDPYLKIGETNDRTSKGESNIVWSLKDINFDINQGDAVGIIGRNGAGKSTLLKVLSRVTTPSTGSIKVKGRIASLLEVGTGFHPELTGRENIYLNGAILGMRKHEIKRKFDEIVDFAGVERYVDTPVKRYSSGMYVRLAFAVAAHLESEILIVDEVLAVGDAEFQKKCLGKMGDVSKGEGRTVLFVSHNMPSVKQLCNKGIVLDKGKIGVDSDINKAIDYYKNQSTLSTTSELKSFITKQHFTLENIDVTINDAKEAIIDINENQEELKFCISGIATDTLQFNIEVRIFTADGVLVSFYAPGHIKSEFKTIPEGKFVFEDIIKIPPYMSDGDYYVNIDLSYPNIETYFSLESLKLVKSSFVTASGRALTYNDVGFFILDSYGK